MQFREYSYNDSTLARLGYFEAYSLPGATAGLTSNQYYSILTTKNTITIAQGGTGATTAANALKNLIGTTAIGSTSKPIYWTGSAFGAVNDFSSLFETFTSSGNTLTIKIGGTQKTASIINSLSIDSTAGSSSATQKLTLKING